MRLDKPQDARRVAFENPIPAHIMAIDGTWRRACTVKDVSDINATLSVDDSIQGLALNEFFLLRSSTGLAYRRCQLERVNGTEIAVSFLRKDKRKRPGKNPDAIA